MKMMNRRGPRIEPWGTKHKLKIHIRCVYIRLNTRHIFIQFLLQNIYEINIIIALTAKTSVNILTLYDVYLEQQIININRCSI